MVDRASADAPTGTVTVVLGDVAGSTRMWQQDAAAMEVASRRVGGLTRELAERHRGHLPREQGEGDNFVAAFAVAADAVAFALALDQALAAEPWVGDLQVAMRIGIHTGDVAWDEHTGYLGPTFNRCARIRDLGHARQILLSQATLDIVADGLGEDLHVDDLGSHQLRDLSRTEHVFQLRRADDDTRWPPLRSVSSLPNNLPLPVTSLVGRAEEIAEVVELLAGHRLVTLTGPGGSGKTRLAQHVASEALRHAPAGAWWVDLMPVTEDEQVATTVAEAARLLEVTSDQQLADAIGAAQMLLVVDNCEHLVDAVADLVDLLLHRCRNVRILATSRETLGIDGERNVRVRPLATAEATTLFRDRAAAVGPLADSADADVAIEEICRRLDGIPLAIELAAARTRLLTPRQIADGLDDRFRLLTSGARRARSRQRTLEASVAWSFDLLDDDEQAVLCRLGVHPAGFTLEGATFVGGLGSPEPHLIDVMTSLVEKSLVGVRPDDHGRRYRLLETIKQYALERLAERGEAEAARDAHLDYVLAAMHDMELRLVERLNDPTAWVTSRAWLDDVRAAQSWAVVSGRATDIIGLHWPNYAVSLITTNHRETVEALEPLLADPGLDLRSRTRVLAMLVAYEGAMGDFTAAARRTDEAVRLARELDDDLTLTGLLASTALARGFASGDGLPFGVEAMERARAYGPAMVAIAGYCLGIAAIWGSGASGDHLEAFREAARAARAARLAPLVVMSESIVAGQYFATARFAEGVELSEQTIEFARRFAPRALPGHAFITGVWGRMWGARGDEAVALAEECLELAGPPGTVSHNLALLARATAHVILSRDTDLARRDLDVLAEALRGAGADFYLALGLGLRARIHLIAGDVSAAERDLDEAESLLPEQGWSYVRGWVAWGRSQLLAREPDARLELAVDMLEVNAGTRYVLGWTLTFLRVAVDSLTELGRGEEAACLIGVTSACLESIGLPEGSTVPGLDAEYVDRLRAGADEPALAAGVARGRTMTVADVVDLLRPPIRLDEPSPASATTTGRDA